MKLLAKRMEKTVGLFVVLALFILVAGLVITTHGRRLLQKSKTVRIYLEHGNGLEVGSKVTLNGLPAGNVEQLDPVTFDKDFEVEGGTARRKIDGVLATLIIFSPYAEKVRQDSKADVQLPFIMGSTAIDILPGRLDSPEAPDGYVLGMKITKGIGGQVEEILGDLQVIAEEFKGIEVELKKTMENVEGITSRINAGNNSIGELLNDQKKMYNQLLEFATDADSAAKGLNVMVDDLKVVAGNLPAVVEDLKSMAANLKPASENFERASRDFEPLVSDARGTMASLEETSDKLANFSQKLPGISRGLSSLIESDLPVLVESLKKVLGELGSISLDLKQATSDLPSLMNLIHADVEDAGGVIKSLKGTWPISGNLPEERVVPKSIRINGRVHKLGD